MDPRGGHWSKQNPWILDLFNYITQVRLCICTQKSDKTCVCVCVQVYGVRGKIIDACVMDRGITRRGGETERERERVGEHR